MSRAMVLSRITIRVLTEMRHSPIQSQPSKQEGPATQSHMIEGYRMIEWFEDLSLGMRFKSETVQILEDDIKRFAAEFDPQPFHLDDEAAQGTLFKGLAASGWHTAALAMRLAVQTRPFGPHPLIGLGVDGLRWMLPVRPNDMLSLEGEVVSLTLSRTKPQGTVLVKWTLYNQKGEAVYTFTPIGFVPCRPA
jgi:acyl dehydratase